MKIKKEKLIPIIVVALGIILVITGIVLFIQDKDSNSKNSNSNNKEEMLAKEYLCTRELTTDEYGMMSEYHIYADDNGNLIRNQFNMKTVYLSDELYQQYTADSSQYEDPMTTYDPETRTVTVSSDYQYDTGEGATIINFKEFKEEIESNEFVCTSIE